MRDMVDYQNKYKTEPGEKWQVRLRRKHVLEIMERYNHSNILEVGCGLEPLFDYMSDFETMTIVEPGHDFVLNAHSIVANKQLGDKKVVNIIEGCLEDVNKEIIELNIRFDYIVVSSLLHELEEPDRLMRTLYNLCDDDTVIHINVSNAFSLHKLIALNMGLIDDVHELSAQQKNMQRNRVFDINSLTEYVSNSGFEVIEKGTFIPKFLTGAQMDLMEENGIINKQFYEGLDSIGKYIPEYGSEIYVQLKKNRLRR